MKISKNPQIRKYLFVNGKELLLDLDNISLSSQEKLSIIKSILTEYDGKQSWANAVLYSIDKLAKLCDNLSRPTFICSFFDQHRETISFEELERADLELFRIMQIYNIMRGGENKYIPSLVD